MWSTQHDLAVSDMMGPKAAYTTQQSTAAVTFTYDVGGLAVNKLKTRRSYYIPRWARNATLKVY